MKPTSPREWENLAPMTSIHTCSPPDLPHGALSGEWECPRCRDRWLVTRTSTYYSQFYHMNISRQDRYDALKWFQRWNWENRPERYCGGRPIIEEAEIEET